MFLNFLQVNGTTKPSLNPSSRTPIIPSLTSRTLQLGNKTSSPNSSPTKKSNSNSSAFSATLSKPIPNKPAVTNASLLAHQANQVAAMAALSSLSYADQTKAMQWVNAAAMMGALTNLPSLNHSQPQLPSNRLQLKVQTSSSSSTSPEHLKKGHATSATNNPLQFGNLASHLAPYSHLIGSGSNGTSPVPTTSSNGSKLSSLKTLNQSIRQIPNPSLLTNKQNSFHEKNSDHHQHQLLQRTLANQLAAATAAAASARTSLS